MSAFNRLPHFTRSPPGLEHRLWRRLPAVLLWGSVLPLLGIGIGHLQAPGASSSEPFDAALLQWDYTMLGLLSLHWTVVLTLAIGCFIVRVMKGPAYVADAYALPTIETDGRTTVQPGSQTQARRDGPGR